MEKEPDVSPVSEKVEAEPQARETILEKVNGEHVRETAMSQEEAGWLESRIPQLPEYQEYKNQPIRLDTIESIVDDFDAQTQGKKDKKAETFRKYLVDTSKNLRDTMRMYHQAILKGEHLAKPVARFHMDAEKRKAAIQAADQSRYNYHNGILTHLRALRRNCLEKFPQELGVHIAEEKFFTEEQLKDENRSSIGEWAYNTVVGERLDLLLEKARDVLQENKKGED